MNNKFYMSNLEDLNEYERQYNKVSYERLCDRVFNSMILCNSITEVSPYLYDNIECGELGEDTEIYQYYLVTFGFSIDYIRKHFNNELIIAYSNELDLYVLMVTHWGTSWDYVLTDLEPTEDIEAI